MSFSAQDVKTLREKTGAGMMDCKKALVETKGDFEAAVDYLKKQGLAKAVKKGDRVAAEGLIFSKVAGSDAVLVELNCETDFVAKNDDFVALGNRLAETLLKSRPTGVEQALALAIDGTTVEEKINTAIAKIGERLSLRRFHLFTAKSGGTITLYSHAGGRIAVLIEITGKKMTDEAGRDVAMQIAAMSPQFIDKTDVPQNLFKKEREIQQEQLKASGKPAEMLDKILAGKLDKFAGDISLLHQIFVKDPAGKKKVGQYLKEIDPDARVVQFVRYAVGEGIEKRKDDFAEEVKKMVV